MLLVFSIQKACQTNALEIDVFVLNLKPGQFLDFKPIRLNIEIENGSTFFALKMTMVFNDNIKARLILLNRQDPDDTSVQKRLQGVIHGSFR
jgi:hypothetical protein